MEKRILEIKNRAERIAKENSIIIFSEENEIIKKLQEIANTDGTNMS